MEVVKKAPQGWTPFISWEKEAIYSEKAIANKIENYPTKAHVENMQALVEHIFLPLRKHIADSIVVSSFYRSEAVNKLTKGASKTSQHMAGEAMDIHKSAKSKYTNKDLFDFIKANLNFDQLIWEHGNDKEPKWVHVSFKRTGKNRKQILYISSE
jgi:zinc D-Ala-D-Ala carboxypeptidase